MGWALAPLGLVVVLVVLAAAEPGPMETWQRWLAAVAILVMMPLTGELLDDMFDWRERKRIEHRDLF